MGFNCFANILVHHPCLILIGVALISGSCLVIPFALHALPNFSDPQMGYQTRGTSIANKLTTWHNLNEELSGVGSLTVNPKEFLSRSNVSSFIKPTPKEFLPRNNISSLFRPNNKTKIFKKKNSQKNKLKPNHKEEYSNLTTTTQAGGSFKILTETSNTTATTENSWSEIRKMLNRTKQSKQKTGRIEWSLLRDGFFCGSPNGEYGHVVLESEKGADLFTLTSLQTICRLQHELTDAPHYNDLCIKTDRRTKCCRPWSLPNYVALLNSRHSCLAITEEDVQNTKALLQSCSQYYHSSKLTVDCGNTGSCKIPPRCIENNAVFQILNFITSVDFLPPNKTNDVILKQTMIFLPVACSAGLVPYFEDQNMDRLSYEGISVVAVQLGIKDAVFDKYLFEDTWFLSLGALLVFFSMWLYTGSLFLTIMAIIAIAFSLGISYFMYRLLFEIEYFPFMNLLTGVIVVGIGADDAFIFCKVWTTMKTNHIGENMSYIMTCTMQHALVSMIITSFTTAAAFFASFTSPITAIKCFSVFASIAVVMNCLLMTIWFPVSIVVLEKVPQLQCSPVRVCISALTVRLCCFSRWTSILPYRPMRVKFSELFHGHQNVIAEAVIRFRYVWFTLLTLIAVISGFIVFYYPKLQLPNSIDVQLFHSSHLFERYDFYYKHRFWFNNNNPDVYLPMRFVWGAVSQDNGDYMEPDNLGTLEHDNTFNMSNPESQTWLLDFCRELKRQPFYLPDVGIILPNCFIEPFKKWMERPCEDDMEGVNHSPCCETEAFPYRSWVFEKCIVNAIADLYATPSTLFSRGAAGPKFSKQQNTTIKSIVIEFSTNYKYTLSFPYMSSFIRDVGRWFDKIIQTAPPTMRGGWFVSDLDFYDLQMTLTRGTYVSILISMALVWIVVLFATLNLVTTVFAIINITCTILVTIAVLVLLGWKLNILESVIVSTTIGLAVDFALHFTVSYKLSSSEVRNRLGRTRQVLSKMLKPVTMSAFTTAVVGACMIPSRVLAYMQIGTFLVIVMCVSWVYSTFHLGAMLAIAGPENDFGQGTYTYIFSYIFKRNTSGIVHTERALSRSESHELQMLTTSSKTCSIASASNTQPSNSEPQPSTSGVKSNNNSQCFTLLDPT